VVYIWRSGTDVLIWELPSNCHLVFFITKMALLYFEFNKNPPSWRWIIINILNSKYFMMRFSIYLAILFRWLKFEWGALIDKWSCRCLARCVPFKLTRIISFSSFFFLSSHFLDLYHQNYLLLTSTNVDYNAIEHIHFSWALHLSPLKAM